MLKKNTHYVMLHFIGKKHKGFIWDLQTNNLIGFSLL